MKRVLAFILTLSILFSFAVPGVTAEGTQNNTAQHVDHSACACAITGAVCDSHTGAQAAAVEWKPWGDQNGESASLPTTEAGNYYLTCDVVLSATQQIKANVNICLNGHSIRYAGSGSLSYGLVRVDNNMVVTIMNCQAEIVDGKLAKGSAGIKNGVGLETRPGGLWINKGANVTLLGVELSGNTSASANTGGWSGGALMTANNPSPTVNIDYCRFDDNKATNGGGGAMGLTAGNINIRNTVFSGNQAKTKGSAIWAATSAVSLNLTNCEFTGNTVTDSSASGAIDISNSGAILTVRGKTVVENNIAKDVQGDIFLVSGAKLTVGSLTEGAKLNVNTANALNATTDFLQVEKDGNNNTLTNSNGVIVYTNRLAAGNKAHLLHFANDSFTFAENTHAHAVCACAISGAACAEHTSAAGAVEWTAWTNPIALPTATTGNYYLTCDILLRDSVQIKADLNICLNGYSIRYAGGGTYSYGLVRIDNSKTVTIMNCKATITDGKLAAGSAGFKNSVMTGTKPGAIWVNQGANLTLLGVELSGNSTTSANGDGWSGGALMLANGIDPTVNIDYCRFANNKATAGGGGAIGMADGIANIRNTVFSGNEAKTKGGAIWAGKNVVALNLTNCEFTGNKSQDNGGAVTVDSGNLTVNSTVFTGNEAVKKGGAVIIAAGGTHALTQSTFTGNKTTDANAEGGAALYINAGTATLSGATMTENTNAGTHGTAITYGGSSTVVLDDCSVLNNENTNSSSERKSGIGNVNANAKLIVRGNTVVDNNRNGTGGSNAKECNIYLRMDGAKLTVGALEANAKITVATGDHPNVDTPNVFLQTEKDTNGQALTPVIDPKNDRRITYENTGDLVGYNAQKTFYFVPNTDHWHAACSCAIANAACDAHTGAAEEHPFAAWTKTDSLPNTAGYYYLTENVVLNATQVIPNGVTICLNGKDITMANGATLNYGLMRINNKAEVTILNCQASITDGKLAENSAGIKNAATTAENKPGAIWINSGAKLTLLGVAISGNTTTGASTGGWAAGGIMTANTDAGDPAQELKIDYCRFDNNSASGSSAGAISLRIGSAVIRNTVFSGNSAKTRGGAIWMSNTASSLDLTNCEFTGNKVTDGEGRGGAALYLDTGKATLTNVTMRANENAGHDGTAISYAGSSTLILDDCTITDNINTNSSNAFKAGIVCRNATATLVVRGSTVVDGNMNGTDGKTKTGTERNLLLRPEGSKLTVGTLDNDAKINVSTGEHKKDAKGNPLPVEDPNLFLLAVTGETPAINARVDGRIVYENDNQRAGYKTEDGKFYFSANITTEHWHAACACAIKNATCNAHAGTAGEQPFAAWTKTDSLPNTAGYYYLTENVVLNATQVIPNGVTICLNGKDITMANGATLNYGLMRINNKAEVTILNCQASITDGKLAENSAGIKNAATTAENKPGAIWINSGAKLTLLGVAISGNTTTGASTGGWAAGGIMTANTDAGDPAQELKIDYCRFDNNSASGSSAGAISLRIGSAVIRNTVFSGNSAKTRGGAIWMSNTASSLDLTNCEFTGNKVTDGEGRGGAALYIDAGKVTLTNVTMQANENAGHDGTAITCAGSSQLILDDCTVTDNINTNSSNAFKAAVVSRNSTATVTVCGKTVIDGNMNGTDGKTKTGIERNLLLRAEGSKLTVGALDNDAKINVSTGEHKKDAKGNPLPVEDPNLFLQAVAGETPAINARVDGRIVYENDNQRVGYKTEDGKFYFSVNATTEHWHPDCACAIKNATCESHSGKEQGYEAWTSTTTLPGNTGYYYLTADVTLSETQVLKNGTVICLNGFSIKQAQKRTDAKDAAVVTLIRVTDKASVTILNCKAKIADGKLAANSAGIKGGTSSTTSAGAIHVNKGGKLNLFGVELSGNSSASDNTNGWGAGALMSAGDPTYPTEFNIAYCRFANNKATANGGGAISLRAGTANIRNTVFTGNEAKTMGGAILMWDTASKLSLTDCEFTGNKAGGEAGEGGAVYLGATKADVTITNTKFDSNEAVKRGGAIYIPKFDKKDTSLNALKLAVTNSTFTANQVTGSDSYGGAAMYISNGTVTLKNVTMTKNKNADRHGSAMVIENSTNTTAVRMEDCTVTGNINAKSAKRGAVVVISTDCLTLAGKTVISDNTNNGVVCNLYLREKTAKVKLDGLKAGSKIGITTGEHNGDAYDVSHPVEDPDLFMTKGEKDTWDASWVLYENSNMAVNFSKADKFYFTVPADHTHCLCGDGKDANCQHGSLTWMPWSDAKSLPTVSGNYYLTTNVTVTKSTELKGTTKINLCLNGRAITYKGTGQSMIFNVINEAQLSIADCSARTANADGTGYTAGKITGATSSCIRIGNTATVSLYDGWIANNTVTSSFGGGIRMVGAATFNMYDGRINRNQTLASKALNDKGEEYTVTKHGGGIGADDNGEGTVTINLYGGEISGNTASGSGGGVHIKGGVLNLKGTNIRWNNAGFNGGGISAQMSDLNLEKGNINDNKAINPKNEAGAETGLGGGVYAVGNNAEKKGAHIKLSGCRIYNNTAWKGGAMLLMYYMTMEYTDGMISGNKADNNCGGIYVINHSDVTMRGGEIAKNTAVSGGGIGVYRAKFTMTGGKIRNNTVQENGGGILAQKGSTVVLSGGFLQDNSAPNPKNAAGRETGMGGGIYTTGEKNPETDRVTLTLSDEIDIHGNKANKGGGVMVQNFTTLNIQGGKIYKNNAIHSGAGVFSANNTEMNISGGDIYGNTAPSAAGIATYIAKVTMTGGKVRDNVSSGNAAGILFQRNTYAVLSGGEIYGNRATNAKDAKGNAAGSGGGIYVMGGKSWDDKCTLTITGKINIHDNKSVKGAGIMLQNFSEMVMDGGVIQNNTSSNNGAGIFPANKSKCTITGGTIRNNNAVSGGGLTAYQAEVEILGGTFTGNTAKEYGAALLIQKGSKVTLNHATITNNEAGKNGGAIHISGTAKLNATGTRIAENKAGEIGGALYASGEHTDITMTECNVFANTAGTDCGGLTIMSHASLVTNDCKINNNTSSGMGGGLYIRKAYLTMNGGEVCGNTAATSGGGMHIEGVDIVMSRKVFEMNGGLISGNSAAKGGGVYLTRDTYSAFNDGVIEGNIADLGGGIYSGTTSLAEIGAIEIKNNTANVHGGGVYLHRGSRTVMTGTKVLENKAKEGAGGIWVNDDFTMQDLTVKGNSAAKGTGGIHIEAADYDGESYVSSIIKMGGNTYIYENTGDFADMYISQGTYVNLPAAGLGQNAKIGVSLQSGLLTRTVIGAYNYEGGNLEYVITCGDRSVTDPEIAPAGEETVDPTEPNAPADEEKGSNLVPILAIAAFVVVIAAVALVLIRKKKKSAAAEES